jgi:hypothetical protein
MKLGDISSGDPEKKTTRTSTGGEKTTTKHGVVHKAGDNYSGKGYTKAGYIERDKMPDDLHYSGGSSTSARRAGLSEVTGDPKFDGMLGKITGNTEPQTTGGAASDKVAAKSAVPPDQETINALKKMMYDMHVTMQTAERLMQKLIQGR